MKEILLQGGSRDSVICVERGILDRAAGMAMKALRPKRVCVVTDSSVAPLYAERVEESFRRAGAEVSRHVIPAGEEHKNLEGIADIYESLCTAGFTRTDMVAALGGGVVGDMAGFAAASFLRGVQLIQIPTTLLAQVDSSVGGKCGVDLPQGKNMVGAFNQPAMVFIDPELLDSLPDSIFCDGMAEVIKYGCIWDEELLSRVEDGSAKTNMEEIIHRCVTIKRDVVQQDERDTSLRMILNFGHTVGHGAEKLGNFTALTHGQGVAIGMVAAARMGQQACITPAGTDERIIRALRAYGLPTALPYAPRRVFEAMTTDKKKQGDELNFIFLEQIGKVAIKKLPMERICTLMEQALKEGN